MYPYCIFFDTAAFYTPNAGIGRQLHFFTAGFWPSFLLLFIWVTGWQNKAENWRMLYKCNIICLPFMLWLWRKLLLLLQVVSRSKGKGAAFLLDFYNYYCCLAHFPPPPSSKSSSVARLLLLLQRNTHKSLVFPHKLLLGPWGYTIVPLACA